MSKAGWTKNDIPSQAGKLAVVTGTGGLGYETALVLIEKGTTVILAGRNESKGQESIDKIKLVVPEAKITFEKVDLGSLTSITEFGRNFNSQHQVLDLLINNAGVMAFPTRKTTEDGFEMQFGTNHLGHFALTSHLLPALRRSQHPRVVNVSSDAHRQGSMHFDDLQWEKSYSDWGAYAQSKLSNILFTLELQRRSDEGEWGLLCSSAHPGLARTDLIANGPSDSFKGKAMKWIYSFSFVSHSAEAGALPILFGATAPEAKPKAYYAPDGWFAFTGAPTEAQPTNKAKDETAAKKLWDISATLTGAKWP